MVNKIDGDRAQAKLDNDMGALERITAQLEYLSHLDRFMEGAGIFRTLWQSVRDEMVAGAEACKKDLTEAVDQNNFSWALILLESIPEHALQHSKMYVQRGLTKLANELEEQTVGLGSRSEPKDYFEYY